MEFEILIRVGMTLEEAKESVLEAGRKYEQGEKYVVKQLAVNTWDQFYALLSPIGLLQMESFIEGHDDISDESLCDYKPLDPTSQDKTLNVSALKLFDAAEYINSAEDVVHFLKETLQENDPVALAEALQVIFRSEGLLKLAKRGC